MVRNKMIVHLILLWCSLFYTSADEWCATKVASGSHTLSAGTCTVSSTLSIATNTVLSISRFGEGDAILTATANMGTLFDVNGDLSLTNLIIQDLVNTRAVTATRMTHQYRPKIILIDSIFRRNTVIFSDDNILTQKGGVLQLTEADATIKNSVFDSNSAFSGGGKFLLFVCVHFLQ